MGKFRPKVSAPPPPPPPPPPPKPPELPEKPKEDEAAKSKKRQKKRLAAGRDSTILTRGVNLDGDGEGTGKKLLGQ